MSAMSIGQIQHLAENPGMPTRPAATAVLTIDSKDRAIGAKVNDFYINKQQTLMNGYFTRLALTELNMDWDIPNVNQRNNTLTLILHSPTAGDVTITITVEPGYYTMTALAAKVQQLITAAVADEGLAAEFTIVVAANAYMGDDLPNRFIFENTLGAPGDKTFSIVPNPLINYSAGGDDLRFMMGLGAIPATAEYQTFYGGYAPMIYTPYFDIVSKQITKKQNVKDNSTSMLTGQNLLARIYLNPDGIVAGDPDTKLGTAPFTINKEFRVPKQIYWDTKEFINVIDITLIDYKGNVLVEVPDDEDAGAGLFVVGTGYTNWQMTLQVTET